MSGFLEQFQQWKAVSGETRSLLDRNLELLDRRARLLHRYTEDLRGLVRVAHEFADRAAESDQEPAARSNSPRSK
ncbi:MAG TPA: hypothetical protein VGD79_13435 [Thermoanaerobaculia bacterium]|jgi:hypothetical protein